MTIEIIDILKPKNGGFFPTHEDVDALGGFQVRNDHADRDSIPSQNRKQGMLVHVLSDGYYYELQSDLTTWIQASFSAGSSIAVDLNITGQQKGSTLYFNGNNWVQLNPGQDGYQLTTHGIGNNPTWNPATSISILSPLDVVKNGTSVGISSIPAREDHRHSISTNSAISIGSTNTEGIATTLARSDHTHAVTDLNISGQAQGDILYFNGSNWVHLQAGQDGYFLQTHSTGKNPTWASASAIFNWYVSTWYINSSTGSDTNDGLTSGTALKTIEELCNRLCPNGEVAFLKQTTTVNIASGTYGTPYFNIGSGSLIINCTITSTANIITNSVTNTNASSSIRGEIETASGTFIDQRRIRVVSGASTGAIAFSTGLNGGANKTFISSFISQVGNQINITVGDNVVVDTLGVTFNSSSLLTTINSSIIITGAIFSNGCYSSPNVTFNECHFSSNTSLLDGGNLLFCSFNSVTLGNGYFKGYGNQFLGICNSFLTQIDFTASNLFDDCNSFIGKDVNFNFTDIELVRRSQTTGFILPVGSKTNSIGFFWSGTGAYATTAVQMDPGSYFSFLTLPTISGLSNITIAGVGFSWSQLPKSVGNATAEFSSLFTSTANDILYWTGSYWERLAAGSDGYVLTTHSTISHPTWNSVTATNLSISGQTQGDVLYYDGNEWNRLPAGLDGYILTTHNTGNNPTWNPQNLFIVNNNNIRNGIPSNFRKEGMIVYSQNTQCYYELQPDLITWSFKDSNPSLANQLNWFLDSTNGNDDNNGLTSITALKTVEELSRRLCPGFRKTFITTNITVSVAAGTYGTLALNCDGPISAPIGTVGMNIIGTISSSSIITLSNVIDTNATTLTRGQIATASGTFVNQKRIRTINGANINATAYSTGLNGDAQHTFVSSWMNFNNGHAITIANGTNVVVDTLLTTIQQLNFNASNNALIYVQDCIVQGGQAGYSDGEEFNNSIGLWLCEISGTYTGSWYFNGKYLSNPRFIGPGSFAVYMGVAQNTLITGLGNPFLSFRQSTCFDNSSLFISNGTTGEILSGSLEWCNGSGGVSVALTIDTDAQFRAQVPLWGNSTNYGIGISIAPNGRLTYSNAINGLAINANTQLALSLQNYKYSDAPIAIPRAGIVVAINPDINSPRDGYSSNFLINGQTEGDILFFDGSVWNRLAAGSDGYVLTTHSTSSAPTWNPQNFFTVNDNNARNGIPSNFRKEGMVVYSKNTQSYYQLQSDLLTWTFKDSNPILVTQTSWFISTTGDDNNDGKTSGTALKTVEEFCQRLCPFGRLAIIPQNINVFIGAGSFGTINLNCDAPAGTGLFAFGLNIFGNVTQNIVTLSSVTNTSAATSGGTRGQIATASGTFINHQRLQCPPNAMANNFTGAIAYSTGLNGDAQHTFISSWMDVSNGHETTVTNGSQCSIDTLNTQIAEIIVKWGQNAGFAYFQDLTITNIISSTSINKNFGGAGGYLIFFEGCELIGNIGEAYADFIGCRFFGSNWEINGGKPRFYGTVMQSSGFIRRSIFQWRSANTVDGANIHFSDMSQILSANNMEFVNGVSGAAFELDPGSFYDQVGLNWSGTGSSPWGIGYKLASNSAMSANTNATLFAINATQQLQVAGQNKNYSDIPFFIPRAMAGVTISPDSTALSDGYASNLSISGQTKGDILFFNGSSWVRLGAGTIGQALITQGTSANPIWDSNFVAQNISTTGTFNVGAPITINSVASNPSILQASSIIQSTSGQTLSITAQSMTGFNTRGGNIQLGSGTGIAGTPGITASDGYIQVKRGNNILINFTDGYSDFIQLGATPGLLGAVGNPSASVGNIRLPNRGLINARNVANNADISIIGLDSSNNLILGSNTAASATGGAATLPSNPTGFMQINLNNAGTIVKIPYYSN